MKVLYVASNPTDESDLNLNREITLLQRSFLSASAETVSFAFLPDLRVEDLLGELGKFKPDVLHLAAHGEVESLSLSNQAGHRVDLTADMLRGFLPPQHLPRLIYLNACNSQEIAKSLVDDGSVPMSIGSTAPITNLAARASAVTFYDLLLAGSTVSVAFEACKKMLEALMSTKTSASANLFYKFGVDPKVEVLHQVPVVVADLEDPDPDPDGHYNFRLGLFGCPPGTAQVVFFTDDESFIDDEDEDSTLEDDLCLVVRTTPVKGVFWAPENEDDYWRAMGDFRVFAVGILSGGGCFTATSTLCEALQRRFRLSARGIVPKGIATVIKQLERENGEERDPIISNKKRRLKKNSKKK